MKHLTFILFLFFSLQLVYAQETIDDRQLSLGVTGVESTDNTTHYISAVGKVWEHNGSSFVISDDQEIYNNQTVSVGNADFGDSDWDAIFNWKWREPGERPIWGLGLYKITLTLWDQEAPIDEYCYLDGRDSNWGGSAPGNPDLYTVFNKTPEEYEIFNWLHIPANIIEIDVGEIIRVWDVKNSQPSTSGLTNFWANALLLIEGGGDHPRIAWGPHPSITTTYFYIYRAVADLPLDPKEQLTFSHCATTNATTYEFIDTEFEIGGSTQSIAFYYVKSYNPSSGYSLATNTVYTSGEYVPYKISVNPTDGIQADEFDLMQNYPNPFNPSTTIKFSVAANSLVSLKVYDILGNEKAILVDELKEPGNYSVNFDASDLSSGIYFYTLRANEYTHSRKMLLLK